MQTTRNNENTIGAILYRVFMGILFGFANVIPGVSGGTVMVVLGVYERIIGILTSFVKKIKQEWKFFLPILIGMGIAVILFGRLMSGLLEKHAEITQMFFIGVIIFSVPQILKNAILDGNKKLSVKPVCVIAFVLMLALMVFMAYSPANDEKARLKAEKETIETLEELAGEESQSAQAPYTPDHSAGKLILLVVYGAVAASTMIIPGISGSLVMVMLGQYKSVMDAIAHWDILFLLPFGVGCLLGIVFCAKLIRWLLKTYPQATYSAILGFVLGSILPVFPGWNAAFSLGGVIAFLIGGACIVGCEMLSPERRAQR